MGVEIASIADRGWESYNFEVGDYEDGRIHFYCATVRVVETEWAKRVRGWPIGASNRLEKADM